jgi:hypothetical protein
LAKRFFSALLLMLLLPGPVHAEIALAVLDFELNDLTLTPGTTAEVERTASLRPLLEAVLEQRGDYRLVEVSSADQRVADYGFGYLYEHPRAAAELASSAGADFVLVCRLHKTSFLFAYLRAQLVQVAAGRVVGHYAVEVKGADSELTQRGVDALAEYIDKTLRQFLAPAGAGEWAGACE